MEIIQDAYKTQKRNEYARSEERRKAILEFFGTTIKSIEWSDALDLHIWEKAHQNITTYREEFIKYIFDNYCINENKLVSKGWMQQRVSKGSTNEELEDIEEKRFRMLTDKFLWSIIRHLYGLTIQKVNIPTETLKNLWQESRKNLTQYEILIERMIKIDCKIEGNTLIHKLYKEVA